MEFKDYTRYLKKHIRTIVAITVAVTVLTVMVSVYRPTTYSTSLSFAVERVNKQTTTDYQFDGYYEIQASDLFSQTVISWFLTPSVLFEIYERAEIDPDIASIDRFANRFKTRQYSPQNIVVRFTEDTKQDAEKLSSAIISVVEEKAVHLNQTEDGSALFNVVGETPVIVENKPNIALNGAIGFIAGLILALVSVSVTRYLKED